MQQLNYSRTKYTLQSGKPATEITQLFVGDAAALSAHPAPKQSLTDEEWFALVKEIDPFAVRMPPGLLKLAKALEARLT